LQLSSKNDIYKPMTNPTRRQVFRLGLTAGITALLAPIGRADAAPTVENGTNSGRMAGDDGLRYRILPGYRPELSVRAQQRLTRAILDFLLDAHPLNTTLSLWDKNPRDIPHLEKHIAAMVGAVFSGVKKHLPKQPVDPVLVVAILYNESRFSPVAVSPSGALGIAQFMPNTALEYDLQPIAQPDLWQRYRDIRAAERARRAERQREFLKRFGIEAFSTTAVIEHALKTDKLVALAEYQALVNTEKPELEALKDYVVAVREELAQSDFFVDGEAVVGRIDARTRYAAATAAVDYIARRLAENSGMTSSAVAAYNAGPAAVRDGNPRSVLYGYGELPAYPETVLYLQRVLVVYSKLRDQLA
jgi:soluble lytic murein transglycosylase-like protein